MSTGCMTTTGLLLSATAFAVLVGSCVGPPPNPPENRSLSTQPAPGLPNLRKIAPGVFIGGAPDSAKGFDSLKALGVRTVLAVDAANPNLEELTARGIQSVHVPIEYAGVTDEQRLTLTKALSALLRPIYIHCHHGTHRAPAAACVALLGTGEIDQARAAQILEDAGTSQSYPGLFDAVRISTRHPDPDSIEAQLPETAPVAPLAETMAKIDRAMDRLGLIEANGWAVPESHPDLAPAALAAQIETSLRTLSLSPHKRMPSPIQNQADLDPFTTALADAAQHASTLESAIGSNGWASATRTRDKLKNSCNSCHTVYRDSR